MCMLQVNNNIRLKLFVTLALNAQNSYVSLLDILKQDDFLIP